MKSKILNPFLHSREKPSLPYALHYTGKFMSVRFVCLISMALFAPVLTAAPVKINGFFSTGVTDTSADNAILRNLQLDDKTNYLADTIFGLQVQSAISDDSRFSAQLSAVDNNNSFDVVAEWLFISHKLSTNTELRAGRLRIPTYFFSETVLVGQTYDWVRPPIEVYALTAGLRRYNGFSALYRQSLQHGSLEAEFHVGQVKDDIRLLNLDATFDSDHFYGGAISFTTDHVVFRAAKHNVQATFSIPGQAIEADTIVSVNVVGLEFTQDYWGFIGEYGVLDFDDPERIEKRETTSAYYLSLYAEINQWTPLITYSASKADSLENIYRGESFSTGVRYRANDVTSYKIEALRGELLDGLSLTILPPSIGYDDKVTVISASINIIY